MVQANTSFESVQRVPPTTKALKQAVTMQPVIVGVDASDWSTNYLNVGICRDVYVYMRWSWFPITSASCLIGAVQFWEDEAFVTDTLVLLCFPCVARSTDCKALACPQVVHIP